MFYKIILMFTNEFNCEISSDVYVGNLFKMLLPWKGNCTFVFTFTKLGCSLHSLTNEFITSSLFLIHYNQWIQSKSNEITWRARTHFVVMFVESNIFISLLHLDFKPLISQSTLTQKLTLFLLWLSPRF